MKNDCLHSPIPTRGGFLHATADTGSVEAVCRDPYLIVVPFDLIVPRCREAIDTLQTDLKTDSSEIIRLALHEALHGDYGKALAHTRMLYRDYGHRLNPSQTEQFRLLDHLSNVHGTVHQALASLHRSPYRWLSFVRFLGTDAILLRIHP